MRLYEEAKTRVRVDSEWSEKIEVNVRLKHQASVLSPFIFTFAVYVFTKLIRGCVMGVAVC